MRWRLTFLSLAIALGPAIANRVAPASADPVTCIQFDTATGLCMAEAGTDSPAPASDKPVVPVAQAGHEENTSAACTLEPEGTVVPCQDGPLGWWVQSRQCYAAPQVPAPPVSDPVWEGHTGGAIYDCTFYLPGGVSFPGTNGFLFWSAASPAGPAAIDPEVLAQRALNSLTIPAPAPGWYPAGTLSDGRPYTVVNAYTWYWTSPDGYRALTARADAGGVWAQVTVTPTSLSFTPGDGAPAVSCRGPGVAWGAGDGPWAPSPAGCDYRYPHSSISEPGGEVTATYGITWGITWTSSTGAHGTLPAITTTAAARFAVAEVEAVVTR